MKRSMHPLLLSCVLACAVVLPHAAPAGMAAKSEMAGATPAQSSPEKLMRQASDNELANASGKRPSLRYRLRKATATSDTTKEIVETRSGAVARLIAIDSHSLSAAQQVREAERLRAVATDPALEAHRRLSETRDAERVEKFLRLMPNAFLYRSAGTVETPQGRMVRLTFTPNPKFSPPDFESRVLTGISGEVWIDRQQLRITKIQGKIFRKVSFGWGILGSLYPGGTMLLEQSQTEACGWQMAHLRLRLDGKALLFKTIHIVLDETASDYHPVPREWNYRDAVQWLLREFEPWAQAKS